MEEIPVTLSNLVRVLEAKKHQSTPYNLLLTSAISLTPDVLKNVCGSTEWGAFRDYLRNLGNDRLTILREHLGSNNKQGYRSLAQLIKACYFSTILTTNLDSTLEEALQEYDVRPPFFKKLIIGRDSYEHINAILDSPSSGIRIIKLHGCLNEGALPTIFPEFFELPDLIRERLEPYLNQDILIVGTLNRDVDIYKSLRAGKNNIYYVLPHNYSNDDWVIQAIEAREYRPASFVISGQLGNFETFFMKLEQLLLAGSLVKDVEQITGSALQNVPTQQLLQVSGTVLDDEQHIDNPSPPPSPPDTDEGTKLPAKQLGKEARSICDYFNDVMTFQQSVYPVGELFREGNEVEDDQYDRATTFSQEISQSANRLIVTIEDLPTSMRSQHYSLMNVLYTIYNISHELARIMSNKDNRTSSQPNIRSKFQQMLQSFTQARNAFDNSGVDNKT